MLGLRYILIYHRNDLVSNHILFVNIVIALKEYKKSY